MSDPISEGLRALFLAEIGNEHDKETGNSRDGRSAPGGASPATLGTALDSVRQGLELRVADMGQVRAELEALVSRHGEAAQVRDFLPDEG